MALHAQSTSIWDAKNVSLDTDYASKRSDMSDRDCFDAYQAKRLVEDELDTALYWQNTDCTKNPSLDVDDIAGGPTWINPPACHRISSADLGWERREQQLSASRAADRLRGPAADKFVADPSLGWGDVLDATGQHMRLASAVGFAASNPGSYAGAKALVDKDVGTQAMPAAAALGPASALDASYESLLKRLNIAGSVAYGLRPGVPLR